MDYLRQYRPEHEQLVTEYYSLMGVATLAPEEIQDRFKNLHEDPLNIPDKVIMYGEQAYRDVIQTVRESIETRRELASEVLESCQEVGEDHFKRYCYLSLQKEGSLSVELKELLKIFHQGMGLDMLASESYRMLVRFQDLLKSIDIEEVLGFMRGEAVKKQHRETRMRKEEKTRERRDLIRSLEKFRDGHPLFLLISGLNIRAADGGEIKNAQMIRGLPIDELKRLSDKAERLAELAKQYGVSIDWYTSEDMKFLLDELFPEEE